MDVQDCGTCAKLFDFFRAMFFAASGIEKCVALREARIEVLCINPE